MAGDDGRELSEVEGRLDGRALLCLLSEDLEESEKETLWPPKPGGRKLSSAVLGLCQSEWWDDMVQPSGAGRSEGGVAIGVILGRLNQRRAMPDEGSQCI